jgi:adenylate cyclase
VNDDPLGTQIRRELRQLSSQGFEVKDLGEKKLKGLENPEYIYLMYPHSLAGRLNVPPGAETQVSMGGDAAPEKGEPGALGKDTQLSQLEVDEVWKLWDIALRLEMLCSALESPEKAAGLHKPELSLLTRMKTQGGNISDSFMVNLLEHQVTRVEVSRSTHMLLQSANKHRPALQHYSFETCSTPLNEARACSTRRSRSPSSWNR